MIYLPSPHYCIECGRIFMSAGRYVLRCRECAYWHHINVDIAKWNRSEDGKAFHRDASKRWAKNHPGYHAGKSAAYRAANPEHVKAYREAYTSEHLEDIREKNKLRLRMKRGDKSAELHLRELQGRHVYCERLHLRALELPCGKTPACHHCQWEPSC